MLIFFAYGVVILVAVLFFGIALIPLVQDQSNNRGDN